MIRILANPVFCRLFSAQVIALLGTGLLTVALGLLAYDLAGNRAGAVLGTAFAIKMLAYVALAPIAQAVTNTLPRKTVLICADIIRASVAIALPFIGEIWQIYVLIFVLQSASAAFTPTFQAVIPDILPNENDYTKALSLSRLAYDIENILSPALAAALLTVMGYHWLFSGTVLGFLGSALLVGIATIPHVNRETVSRGFLDRLTRGSRIYLATPRLRGLLALTFTAAAASAFVLVNTVVVVRVTYAAGETQVAQALAAYGAGSMGMALLLPGLLKQLSDRPVMISASFALAAVTMIHGIYGLAVGPPSWSVFLALWLISGALFSAILTPAGRLLRSSSHPQDRPTVFTAQFALSHACWLVTYPLAGWAGLQFGLPHTLLLLGALAMGSTILALRVWPQIDPSNLTHDHADLPLDHPHLRDNHGQGTRHRHRFIIDDQHAHWPRGP